MFLRANKRFKDGKTHRYWSVVENRRVIGGGSVQKTLLNAVVGAPGVKVVAVSDVYRPHLRKGVERSQNPDVKTYADFEEREIRADLPF